MNPLTQEEVVAFSKRLAGIFPPHWDRWFVVQVLRDTADAVEADLLDYGPVDAKPADIIDLRSPPS